ncbi:MAG: cation:proton antiporter, partial [Dehalococcoidia bacterium]|nr:cation:proton antiporter [Dehalococcoidia bacterium]
MTEDFSLVRDLAVIMFVAGGVTLIFRWLRQPPVVGYLLAGFLVGPYALPVSLVEDVRMVRLLAELGIVLLLFGLGLEFTWSKLRLVGLAALGIGGAEILATMAAGYQVGRLLGWPTSDSIFLGSALAISSSAILSKMILDMGWKDRPSARLIVGILVVEDFAAVTLLALLSGVSTTGVPDLSGVGLLLLKLVFLGAASLVVGLRVIPPVLGFVRRFQSEEAMLITALGMCFALAMFSRSLELTAAVGAFLMGALIGDSPDGEHVARLVFPVRDMFAAIFFVSIGMLIQIMPNLELLMAVLAVTVVFVVVKVVVNTVAAFLAGFGSAVSLRVGMGMPQSGEFSLVISKLGVDTGVVGGMLYPVLVATTTITSWTTPHLARSADAVGAWLERRSPGLLRDYVASLGDWLHSVRASSGRHSQMAVIVRHAVASVMVNMTIVAVLLGAATAALQFAAELAPLVRLRVDVLAMVVGGVTLLLVFPSLVVIWRDLRVMVDEVASHTLGRRQSARHWPQEALRHVLRESIALALVVVVGLWSIPFIARLVAIGSLALVVPLLLLVVVSYFTLGSVRDIYSRV